MDKQQMKRMEQLYEKMSKETTKKGMKIMGEIIELELMAEAECNK